MHGLKGVDLTGSIVITRYGGVFRGLKVSCVQVRILTAHICNVVVGEGCTGVGRSRSIDLFRYPRRWYSDRRKWIHSVRSIRPTDERCLFDSCWLLVTRTDLLAIQHPFSVGASNICQSIQVIPRRLDTHPMRIALAPMVAIFPVSPVSRFHGQMRRGCCKRLKKAEGTIPSDW